MRDKIKHTIGQEEESLAQFKEEQNEKILELRLECRVIYHFWIKHSVVFQDYNWHTINLFNSAKQNELQEDYYAVEAKRAELQRIMDAEGKHFAYIMLATKFFDFIYQ